MTQEKTGRSAATDLRTTAAERLERVRKECGYERLADLHSALEEGDGYTVSYSSVSNYHNVERRGEPPASYFVRIAEVTGARLEWLLRGEGPMFADEAHERPVPEPSELQKIQHAFWEELPLQPTDSLMGFGALAELQQAFIRGAGDLGEEDYRRFGRDVATFLRLPYEKLGFSGRVSGRLYSQYVFALVNALLPIMPERGSDFSSYPFRAGVSDEGTG